MPTTRKQTPQQARTSATHSSLTPLFAVAGLTDVLAEEARQRLLETQKRATQRLTDLRRRPDELARFVAELPVHLRALPSTTRERAQQLSEQATERISEAGTAYADLAGRGKRRVDEAVSTAQSFGSRARTQARDGLKQADPVFETVQEAATELRRNATGRTATETVTPRRRSRPAGTKARTGTAATGAAKARGTGRTSATGTRASSGRTATTGKRAGTRTTAKKSAARA